MNMKINKKLAQSTGMPWKAPSAKQEPVKKESGKRFSHQVLAAQAISILNDGGSVGGQR
jgi:hypothetical protein